MDIKWDFFGSSLNMSLFLWRPQYSHMLLKVLDHLTRLITFERASCFSAIHHADKLPFSE